MPELVHQCTQGMITMSESVAPFAPMEVIRATFDDAWQLINQTKQIIEKYRKHDSLAQKLKQGMAPMPTGQPQYQIQPNITPVTHVSQPPVTQVPQLPQIAPISRPHVTQVPLVPKLPQVAPAPWIA